MKAQHTQGPWQEFSPNGQITIMDSHHHNIVARLDEWKTPSASAEMAANARLIAASPELLSALSNLLSAHELLLSNGERISPMQQAAVEQARAAILKATGGEA